MKTFTSLLAVAVVLGVFLAVQAFTAQSEAVAWGLPEGFNPETGKIEKTSDVHKASSLMGTTARSDRGERLGTVEEILFSDDGRIEYLVLAREDRAVGGIRLVPIPWEAAKAEFKDDRLILSVDKRTFENAPSFARNDWERLDDPQWNSQVHSYY